jgi:hypothetical protein
MVAVEIFNEQDELIGIYPDMRSQGIDNRDRVGLVDVALRFFRPLIPKSNLVGKIVTLTTEPLTGRKEDRDERNQGQQTITTGFSGRHNNVGCKRG